MHRAALTNGVVLVALLLLSAGVASAAGGAQPLLLFATDAVGARGSDVVVQHLDGTGRTSLTGAVGHASNRSADTRPCGGGEAGYWSPDGTRIAFPDGQGRLEVAAPDGSSPRVIAAGAVGGAPSWSPDGRSIAYSAARILPGPYTRFGP